MNRRQFLTSVAGLGVSVALPAKALPDPPMICGPIDQGLNLYPGNVVYVTEHYNGTHIRSVLSRTSWRTLNAGWPLDSRREPWQDGDAGDVPVQE